MYPDTVPTELVNSLTTLWHPKESLGSFFFTVTEQLRKTSVKKLEN